MSNTMKKNQLIQNSRIAIVVSRFNEDITSKLTDGAVQRLQQLGVKQNNIKVIQVPGAIEIPLVAAKLARQQKYAAIIALGSVIRGETSHYEYVCSQVSSGCQQVALNFEMPVIFEVLMTEDKAQALARIGGAHGHKGCEAADVAIEMIVLLKEISSCETINELV